MKMKKSLLVLSLCFTPLLLNSCGEQQAENVVSEFEKQTKDIYQKAVSAGFTGTYEEWLESIAGEKGEDGKSITSIRYINTTNNEAKYIVIFNDGTTQDLVIPLIKGDTGDKGDKGDQGDKGDIGPVGPQGPAGQDGAPGTNGVDGKDGHTPKIEIIDGHWVIDDVDTNISAINGQKGDKGDKGDQGEIGPQGPQGPTGQNGQDGNDGLDGSQILTGTTVPSTTLGKDGDYYLNTQDGKIYKKENDKWVNIYDLPNEQESKRTHTVTFNTGTDEIIPAQTVEHGEKIKKPATPHRDFYTFEGWEYQDEIWQFPGYVCTEDMVLNAVWKVEDANYQITNEQFIISPWTFKSENDIRTIEFSNNKNYDINEVIKAGIIKIESDNPSVVTIDGTNLIPKSAGTANINIKLPTQNIVLPINLIAKTTIGNYKINYGDDFINHRPIPKFAFDAVVVAKRLQEIILYDGKDYLDFYTGMSVGPGTPFAELLIGHQYEITNAALSQFNGKLQISGDIKYKEQIRTISQPAYTICTDAVIDEFMSYRDRPRTTIYDYYVAEAVSVDNAKLIEIYTDVNNNVTTYTFMVGTKKLITFGQNSKPYSYLNLGDVVKFTGFLAGFNTQVSAINLLADSDPVVITPANPAV